MMALTAVPKLFKPVNYGADTDALYNSAGGLLFRTAEVSWSKPEHWEKEADAPTGSGNTHCLYVLLRDHHKAKYRERIVYAGIASDLSKRFKNHPKAKEIASTRGTVSLSVGSVNFGTFRTAVTRPKPFLEELEHFYIWVLWNANILNQKKSFTLPGQGKNRGNAWHIHNSGHRFAGQMPLELIYPWMLHRPGRDKSLKPIPR